MRRLHFEFGMALATLWGAFVLWSPPPTYGLDTARWALAERIVHQECNLAMGAAAGAMILLTGLACVWCRRCLSGSDHLRMAGLAIVGAFWLLIGASFFAAGPGSVTALLLVMAGLGCYGAMALIAVAPAWRWPW